MTEQRRLVLAGVIGLLAALRMGAGEFLRHFDPQGRFEGGYDFMRGLPAALSLALPGLGYQAFAWRPE